MKRITPIGEMWSWWSAWVVWLDKKGWHDCTGSIVKETQDFLVVGNREDHRRFRIDRDKIQFIEEIKE